MADRPSINVSIASAGASAEFEDAHLSTAAQLPDHEVLIVAIDAAGFVFTITDNNGDTVAQKNVSFHDVADWIREP